MYIRFTHNKSPMSDWGHAMFEKNDTEESTMFGRTEDMYCWKYDGTKGVAIKDLMATIKSTWDVNPCEGYEEDVITGFNPVDIVNSAESWDNGELLEWFCENIAIPMDISAVITTDGAIVFDEQLIDGCKNPNRSHED